MLTLSQLSQLLVKIIGEIPYLQCRHRSFLHFCVQNAYCMQIYYFMLFYVKQSKFEIALNLHPVFADKKNHDETDLYYPHLLSPLRRCIQVLPMSQIHPRQEAAYLTKEEEAVFI